MANKLTDRERKYLAEATKAKVELRAMKARTSEQSELHNSLLNIGRELHRIGHEQREQAETLARYERQIDRIEEYAHKDRELIKEVNAHLWKSGNRLDGVRDILLKRMVEPNVRPSWWQRLLNRMRRAA